MKLHRAVRRPLERPLFLNLPDVEDADDVGVVERRRRARLAQHARRAVGRTGALVAVERLRG